MVMQRCPPELTTDAASPLSSPPSYTLTRDSVLLLEQQSASAPMTRKASQASVAGSAVVRLPMAQRPATAQRMSATRSVPRPSTAAASAPTLRQRRDLAARTPPPAPRYLPPFHYSSASRRGPNSLGNGRINNKSLSRAELGTTPFGMPRWECPGPALDENTEKMLTKLFDTPPPTSPLRRFRSHQSLPPRWQHTQHKFSASFRAG